MKFSRIIIAICMLFISSVFALSVSEDIRINQLGFYPASPKMAIVVETSAIDFFVTTTDLKDTVFTGTLGASKNWSYSDENVKQADFSELTQTGTFILIVPGVGNSAPFDIKPRVHQEVGRAAIKAFYYQRMSIDLEEEYAGKWVRPMGHPDTEVLVHSSAASAERPEGTVLSCPKGWYDAGDFNKYIVNSGYSVNSMLSIYEHFPEYCKTLETNIPESGDSIPDLLDETLWNIRWMLTMQDPNDGGVYHKCTHANFSGTVMPHQATAARYVVQKSSPAALNFAATMAQTSRIFREFETEMPGFADSCLTAAIYAWNWARQHPHTYYRQNQNNQTYQPSITTGEYGDNDDTDEFQWAAAELFITTGQDSFLNVVNSFNDKSLSIPGWRSVKTLAYYSLTHHRDKVAAVLDTTALKNLLINFADDVKAEIDKSAYHVMINRFNWGCNSNAADQTRAMLQAYELSGDVDYLNAGINNLDYLFGRNATTFCFVSDFGYNPPMNFHHRPSEADDVVEPVPGLLAGGPNPAQQDGCDYPSDLPAKSYVDTYCSYASNEICINWNSPLAYAAVGTEALLAVNNKPNTIAVDITAPKTDDTFTTSDPIDIQVETSVEQGNIVKVEYFANDVKIGESNTAPFNFTWIPNQPGFYAIVAKAVSDEGYFESSESITVTVFNAESVGDILFIVGSTQLTKADKALNMFLIQNDYTVTIQVDDDTADFSTADKDAILISSSTRTSTKIRKELVELDVPLMCWKTTIFDDLGLTNRKRNVDYGTEELEQFSVISTNHPLVAGLPEELTIAGSPVECAWGLPGTNGQTITASPDDPTKATLFVYEKGVIMARDIPANARRGGLWFTDDALLNMTDLGWQLFKQALEWIIAEPTSVENEMDTALPQTHQLRQNYPNPFNPETSIRFALKNDSEITLTIYNTMGQLIKTLVNENRQAGEYSVVWNGRDNQGRMVSNGLYLCKMQVGDFVKTRKMVMIK